MYKSKFLFYLNDINFINYVLFKLIEIIIIN